MNGRIKLFILFLMMILTTVLTVYITYAWFTVSEKSKPIIITTGSLRQTSSFWHGIDPDFDGIFGEDAYDKITKGGYLIENLTPGQIYSFKILVRNEGTVDGTVIITMNNIVADNELLLSGLTLRYIDPLTDLPVEKTLADNVNNKIVLVENYVISGSFSEQFTFKFTIEANGTIPATLNNASLLITNYIISLVQADIE